MTFHCGKIPVMGTGFYERIVRSVERCLKMVSRKSRFTDELLRNNLCERSSELPNANIRLLRSRRTIKTVAFSNKEGEYLQFQGEMITPKTKEGMNCWTDKHLNYKVLEHFWKRWQSEYNSIWRSCANVTRQVRRPSGERWRRRFNRRKQRQEIKLAKRCWSRDRTVMFELNSSLLINVDRIHSICQGAEYVQKFDKRDLHAGTTRVKKRWWNDYPRVQNYIIYVHLGFFFIKFCQTLRVKFSFTTVYTYVLPNQNCRHVGFLQV